MAENRKAGFNDITPDNLKGSDGNLIMARKI
jgi:hypothetical protein